MLGWTASWKVCLFGVPMQTTSKIERWGGSFADIAEGIWMGFIVGDLKDINCALCFAPHHIFFSHFFIPM
jgi:hypothetical protein